MPKSGDHISAVRPTVIYALRDPTSGEARYVGKVLAGRMGARLSEHVQCARNKSPTKCHRWIRGLLDGGFRPVMTVLEVTTEDRWEDAERGWIRVLKANGVRLLNHTLGGQGAAGRSLPAESMEGIRFFHLGSTRSDEAKARMRAAWTPERHARHRALHSGKQISRDQREQHSRLMSGRKRDLASVEAGAAKQRGRTHGLEQRARAGRGVSLAWTPERRLAQAERMRKMRRDEKC